MTGPLMSQLKWWGFSDMGNGMQRQIEVGEGHHQLNSQRRESEKRRNFTKRIYHRDIGVEPGTRKRVWTEGGDLWVIVEAMD